jgi:hypothetical protein
MEDKVNAHERNDTPKNRDKVHERIMDAHM